MGEVHEHDYAKGPIVTFKTIESFPGNQIKSGISLDFRLLGVGRPGIKAHARDDQDFRTTSIPLG
jgi:hypothetical protein